MKQDESSASEWKKTNKREKLGSECDFRIGIKENDEKWIFWEQNDYRTFTPKFSERKGIVWV